MDKLLVNSIRPCAGTIRGLELLPSTLKLPYFDEYADDTRPRMAKQERVARFRRAIQQQIVSCPNEQTWDKGSIVWISGAPTTVSDLLMSYGVPEDMEQAVAAGLRCPRCGSDFEVWDSVGTLCSFESAHKYHVERSMQKYGEKLYEFSRFLSDSPLAGLQHPVGKMIAREIGKAWRSVIGDEEWFQARSDPAFLGSPAPRELVPDHRFNSSGQACWYFSESPSGAAAETTYSTPAMARAWVQRNRIKGLDPILDLVPWSTEDDGTVDADFDYIPKHDLFLTALIFCDLIMQKECQRAPGELVPVWKPHYTTPRFVADVARRSGFLGILYASVRFPGRNLVVFDPSWRPTAEGSPFEHTLTEWEASVRERIFWNAGERIIM